MIKKNKFLTIIPILLFAWGCATTPAEPHIFISKYAPLGDDYFADMRAMKMPYILSLEVAF